MISNTLTSEMASNDISIPAVFSDGEMTAEGATTSGSTKDIAERAAPFLNAPIQPIHWIQVIELCYSTSEDHEESSSVCFACKKSPTSDQPLKLCGQCKVAGYCSKECQVQDWKRKHKGAVCSSYQRMVLKPLIDDEKSSGKRNWSLSSIENQCNARNEFFGRLRFYICPYAVFRHADLGRGFVFVQTNHTLTMISLAIPIDCWGRSLGMRSCTVHYLTVGEYDQEICRDDFEMTMVRKELQNAVAEYDPLTQIVVLMRFRCGHVALGQTPLVPDYKLCQRLGKDYYASNAPMGSLLLNLDDSS
jgi:MYND finger